MSIHPPPSTDPPSRPPTPDPEEEDEESDQSLTVILVSDLEEEDEYADPAITTSKHESTASPSSEDESPLEPFAEEGGYVEIEPVTQSAYIELGDIQLTQTEIPRLHEPVDEIFHGEYSPVQDTWIRDETAVVSKAAYDGLVTAFEMAFWFVAHAKSMRILPELMCVGMPLGWVNAMTCMITNVLAVHRWLIVIDKNLKPNVFTCWAGPGVRGHVDAARAIYINSRVSRLVHEMFAADQAACPVDRERAAQRHGPVHKAPHSHRRGVRRGHRRVPQVLRELLQYLCPIGAPA